MNPLLNVQLLPVTILYGSLSVLVTLLLAANVSLNRLRHRAFVGDTVPARLHKMVRAHGNSAEYLAVTIFLLAFLELQHVGSFWLHLCGGILVLARILHSLTMIFEFGIGTFTATTTYVVSFFMAIWSLVLRLR